MSEEIVFRIYAGEKYVDVKTVTEGISIERLLEVEEGEDLENSVYLREPNSLNPSEIRSFLTAMKGIEIVKTDNFDALVKILLGDAPSLRVVDDEVFELTLSKRLIERPRDRRRTLAGNLGLFYSLSLYLFEKKFGIVSYHSSAMVDEKKRLVFINGGEASSGKSVIMLDFMSYYGTDADYRVLSTEMGHFSIRNEEFVAYAGAAFDNISLFPDEPEKMRLMNDLFPGTGLPDPDADSEVRGTDGSIKTAISVKDYYASQQSYSSDEGFKLVYLMPTIKRGKATRDPFILQKSEYSGLLSSLAGVARQKLGQKQPSWIYDEMAALLLPAWIFSKEQYMQSKTIEDSLKGNFLKAVVEIEGSPVDFNKSPGQYWKKIVKLLDLR